MNILTSASFLEIVEIAVVTIVIAVAVGVFFRLNQKLTKRRG